MLSILAQDEGTHGTPPSQYKLRLLRDKPNHSASSGNHRHGSHCHATWLYDTQGVVLTLPAAAADVRLG